MVLISRLITGIIFILVGVTFLFIPFFGWIYGLILLVVGLIILLNKSEDKIEQRKDIKTKMTNL